jgi:hypothetical protein
LATLGIIKNGKKESSIPAIEVWSVISLETKELNDRLLK